MSLSLSPETQALIEERMKRGGYPTADDVVRVALDVLHQVEDEDIDDQDVADIPIGSCLLNVLTAGEAIPRAKSASTPPAIAH